MRIVRAGVAVLVVVGLTLGVGACSKGSSDASGPSTTVPEDVRTTPAKVAAGLSSINATAAKFAATVGDDKDQAQILLDQIQPQWYRIEGTIKANDTDAYLAFEDAIAVLHRANEKADRTLAARGSRDVAAATAAYLQTYPG